MPATYCIRCRLHCVHTAHNSYDSSISSPPPCAARQAARGGSRGGSRGGGSRGSRGGGRGHTSAATKAKKKAELAAWLANKYPGQSKLGAQSAAASNSGGGNSSTADADGVQYMGERTREERDAELRKAA